MSHAFVHPSQMQTTIHLSAALFHTCLGLCCAGLRLPLKCGIRFLKLFEN